MKNPHHWNDSMMDSISSIKDELKSGNVLDVGAGGGQTEKLFKNSKFKWTGIDYEPRTFDNDGLGGHKIKYGGETNVVHGDAHNLQFEDETFDLVLSIACFEHLHSPWVAIKEINRVMKPNSFFFGTVAFLEPEHGKSHFHMTRNGISHLLEFGGFEVLKIEPTKGWNVVTSMNLLFMPKLFRRIRSFLYFNLRKLIIRTSILFSNNETKNRRLTYMSEDELRYAGSIIFLGKKK